jgi:hypothetical protein
MRDVLVGLNQLVKAGVNREYAIEAMRNALAREADKTGSSEKTYS